MMAEAASAISRSGSVISAIKSSTGPGSSASFDLASSDDSFNRRSNSVGVSIGRSARRSSFTSRKKSMHFNVMSIVASSSVVIPERNFSNRVSR